MSDRDLFCALWNRSKTLTTDVVLFCIMRSMKKPLILALLSLLIAGCSFQKETKIIVEKREREPKAEIKEEIIEEAKEEIKEEDLSSNLLVNKEHGLDPSYAPGEDPIAKEALLALLSQMQNEGLNVSDRYSGFRSYEYQSELYADYVMQYGQEEADRFSARPGFSEHQTGLAFDLMHEDGTLLTNPLEASWLEEHAAEYGFIVRYPEGKEEITGYMAEPWHIRYIGEEAIQIRDSGLTLEEYINLP